MSKDDTAAQPQDLGASFDTMKQVMDIICPAGPNVEITDIFGQIHKVSTVLSARRQMMVLREMEGAVSLIMETISTAQAPREIFLALTSSMEALEAVGKVFAQAYPEVIGAASRCDDNIQNLQDAIDLFAAEEVVAAIVPLFVRSAARVMELIQVEKLQALMTT